MNHGIDLQREKEEIRGDEWQFGATSSDCIFAVPITKRDTVLPAGELQAGKEDYMDCVARAYINILETKFTHRLRNSQFKEENKKWLADNGYIVFDGAEPRIEFSDRFVAIKSGTRRTGNSLKAPADTIYRQGLIPKFLFPADTPMTWDEYHDKTQITKEMEDLAQEFLKRFGINYEQVPSETFVTALEKDMVSVVGYAWPSVQNGEYPRSNNTMNHAFMAFALPSTYIFDNYPETTSDQREWVKKLAADYKFFNHGYRIYVSGEYTSEEYQELLSLHKTLMKKMGELISRIVNFFKESKPEQTIRYSRHELFDEAKQWIGKDASPGNNTPDELACAESVSTIVRQLFSDFPIVTGTWTLWETLVKDKRFKGTLDLEPGNIIISPTGKGNGSIRGHVGIIGEDENIMSNDSRTGNWMTNYTVAGWVARYRRIGGFPIYVFEIK